MLRNSRIHPGCCKLCKQAIPVKYRTGIGLTAGGHVTMPDDRRIGLSMHFIPPQARQIAGPWDSAALVRGEDAHGHFHHTPRPKEDFDPEAAAFHQRATSAVRDILYRDAEQNTRKL